MGADSKIAWTDHTFNPVWGCAKVSPGCDNCYASAQANRFGDWWGPGKPRREFGDKHWNEPLKWDRSAAKAGKRARVFCASMADVFDKDWPDGARERLWALIKATPNLDWIIVTKRIGNAAKMLPQDWGNGYPNVALLITVVNQAEADRDIPKLLDTAARLRGVSVEPQLGHIHLGYIIWPSGERARKRDGINALLGIDYRGDKPTPMPRLDWVICGSESGPKRRHFDLDWARSLRDQCEATGTSFFLKQIPGPGARGVIDTPMLDGRQWVQTPWGER